MSKLKNTSVVKEEENSMEISTNKKENSWSVIFGGVGKCELDITEKSKLIFSITENQETGEKFIDIRQYVSGKKYTGLTSKGITIPLGRSDDFKGCIEQMYRAVQKLK